MFSFFKNKTEKNHKKILSSYKKFFDFSKAKSDEERHIEALYKTMESRYKITNDYWYALDWTEKDIWGDIAPFMRMNKHTGMDRETSIKALIEYILIVEYKEQDESSLQSSEWVEQKINQAFKTRYPNDEDTLIKAYYTYNLIDFSKWNIQFALDRDVEDLFETIRDNLIRIKNKTFDKSEKIDSKFSPSNQPKIGSKVKLYVSDVYCGIGEVISYPTDEDGNLYVTVDTDELGTYYESLDEVKLIQI